ncbi:hypothetical protein ILYODFUR_022581 [Ilyodon furcidens]|uniref:Uncharacterized protein n=1 Tax=Ilyodon furcidens TaxID=33524 RepID=A0ABV0TNB4_9TELE
MRETQKTGRRKERERAGCCRLRDALTHQRVTAVTAVGTEHPLPGKRNKAVYCIIEGIQLSFILLSRINRHLLEYPVIRRSILLLEKGELGVDTDRSFQHLG